MQFKLIKKFWKSILYLLVFMLSLEYFLPARLDVDFYWDESQWIYTSKYLEEWQSLPETNYTWEENYWTLTQPPITRYFIGIARKAAGFEVSDLNRPWNLDYNFSENISRQNFPSNKLLYISRIPMALLTAIFGTIIFGFLLDGAGIISAFVFIFLFLRSEYIHIHMLRAMSESPLMIFIALTILFSILSVRKLKMIILENQSSYKPYYLLLCGAGISCGLATASKINGLLISPIIILLPAVELILHSKTLPKLKVAKIFIFTILIVMFFSILTFILVNPFLYHDSLARIVRIYENRVYEMSVQIMANPNNYFVNSSARFDFLLHQFLDIFLPFNYLLNKHLSVPGFVFVLIIIIFSGLVFIVKDFISKNKSKNEVPIVWNVVLMFAPLMLAAYMSPLNYQRYFLPCILVYLIIASTGFGFIVALLGQIGKRINSYMVGMKKKSISLEKKTQILNNK